MKKLRIKYFYLLLILIILFTIGYVRLYYREGSSSDVIQKAFKASGANLLSSEFYVWAKAGSEYHDFDELTKLADNLAADMNIVKNDLYSRRLISNDFIDKMVIIATTEQGNMINICAQSERNSGSTNQSYITVSVTKDSPELKLNDTYESLLDVLNKYKIEPKINTCVTGYFEGKLDYNTLNRVSRQIFNDAKAKKVNGITDNNLISVSAYSPGIEKSILINGKRVNMNLAIRYNSYEDKTYIWLATPVITVEY